MDAAKQPADTPQGTQDATPGSGPGFGDAPTIQPLPENSSPEWLLDGIFSTLEFIKVYGWFIVLACAIVYFIWTRVRDRFYALQDELNMRREARNVDPALVASRQEAMAAARERMQRETSEKAAQLASRQKEGEERKRQDRIEEWEKQQRGESFKGRGYRIDGQEEGTTPTSRGPRRRPRRPDDYNPLMGGGGGSGGYRPSQARGRSGGG